MLESQEGLAPKHIAGVAIVVIFAVVAGGYAIREHGTAQNLAVNNAQTTAALSATQHQLSDLASKVNTLAARAEAPPAPVVSSTRSAGPVRAGAVRRADDPRYKKLQSQLDAQGKAIDQARTDLASTQGDLVSARTELTGSIAHTHDELVLLQKKGERSYAEFDVQKSKQFKREGPVEVRLKKADTKHQFADMELMVDDRNLSQKHVNLYQPVMFYTPDSPQPIEVVINDISKDHIHGYVSASKYRQSDLASMSTSNDATAQNAGQTNANTSQPPASPRQRLPMPQ
ncbi:MAG TPA: hypothetical protein VGN01_02470 [Acidobacteriaceae bacterium]|jgi:hypothetical protein